MKPWQERRGVEFVVVEIALHLERPARRSRRRRHATSSSSSDFVILARPAAGEPPFVGALADVVFGTHCVMNSGASVCKSSAKQRDLFGRRSCYEFRIGRNRRTPHAREV
jgi:hypothetical protein